MDKLIKYSIIIGVLIIALSVAYYLVIFLPKKEEIRIELQKQEQLAKEKEVDRLTTEKEANKKDLEHCLLKVKLAAANFWQEECESMGRGEDCRLPEYNANRIDKSLKEDEENCFRKYPQ